MMQVSIAFQTMVFLQAIVLGLLIGIVYDFLRAIRCSVQAGRRFTALCDGIFWIITVLSGFVFILTIAQGSARAYILVGVILGSIFYAIAFSTPVFGAIYHFLQLNVLLGKQFYRVFHKTVEKAAFCAKWFCEKIRENIKKILSFFPKKR